MTERESMTQVQEGQGAATTRGKGGKGQAGLKRSKAEAPSQQQEPQVEGRRSAPRQPVSEWLEGKDAQDPQLIGRIQQRAYLLFEARGFEHGHDLEHWLEAERQITGSLDRPER
jgi:hypothetical protein